MTGCTLDDVRSGKHKSEAPRMQRAVSFSVLSFPIRFSAVSIGHHPKAHGQPLCRAQPRSRSDSRGLHLLLQPCILFLLHPCSLHKPKDHLEGCLQLCCLHVNSPNHFTLPLNLSFVSLFLPFIHSPLFFNFFFPQTLPLNHLYSAWTLLASSTGLRTHRNLTLWEIPSVI